MKYKLLIVDDNYMQIQTLLTYIEKGMNGEFEIKTARNGRAGLECFQAFLPHIVITDVVMPVMDGLEMVKEIRKINNDAKFIFISCYEEFEILKKVMESNAVSYILKPIRAESLYESIEKSIAEIETERKYGELDTLLSDSLELYRENFFNRLLYAQHWEEDDFEKSIAVLEYDQYNSFLIVKIDVMCTRRIDIYNIFNLTKKTLLSGLDGTVVVKNETSMFAMFMGKNCTQEQFKKKIYESLELYRGRVHSEFKVMLNIGLSEVHATLKEAVVMIEEATNALENNLSFDKGGVHIYNELLYENPKYNVQEIKEMLEHLIYSDESDKTERFINKFYENIDAENIYVSKTFCTTVLVLLQLVLHENNLFDSQIISVFSEFWSKINDLKNYEEVWNCFKEILLQILSTALTRNEQRYEGLIADIDKIIEKDYKHIKNVQDICSRLFVSASYARKIYKQHTGITIYEKLFITKMEKAKSLLAEKISVQNVATLVGYKSKTAFLEAFKRYTESVPMDYNDIIEED
ncbi:MAG: response regulator [Clostridia bacterium]|nr:response regulator [Clostridia bacterium]